MNKIYCIILSLILCSMAFIGCGVKAAQKSNYHAVVDDKEWPSGDTTEPFEGTSGYGVFENSSIIDIDEAKAERFNVFERMESAAPLTVEVNILGTKYVGDYQKSVQLPLSDMRVRVYELQGTEYGIDMRAKVFIDIKTGQIVEWSGIPYDASEMKDETDYIEFVKAVLNAEYNFDLYDYECLTYYADRGEDGTEGKTENGFHVCSENEELESYAFHYVKSIEGITIPDHISAEFFASGRFYLEAYEFGYEYQNYEPIIEKMSEIEASVQAYITTSANDGCTITNIQYDSKQMFIQYDVPYILTTCVVTYTSSHSDGEYGAVIKVITGL